MGKTKRHNSHQIPHLKVLYDNADGVTVIEFTWDNSFVMKISLQWKTVNVKKSQGRHASPR